MQLGIVVRKVNVITPVAKTLFGPKHKFQHRACIGVIVMAFGVTIAKTAGHMEPLALAVIGDMIGYGVHGLGLVPFLEKLIEIFAEAE